MTQIGLARIELLQALCERVRLGCCIIEELIRNRCQCRPKTGFQSVIMQCESSGHVCLSADEKTGQHRIFNQVERKAGHPCGCDFHHHSRPWPAPSARQRIRPQHGNVLQHQLQACALVRVGSTPIFVTLPPLLPRGNRDCDADGNQAARALDPSCTVVSFRPSPKPIQVGAEGRRPDKQRDSAAAYGPGNDDETTTHQAMMAKRCFERNPHSMFVKAA